jgi:hypothetical protein
MCSWVFMSFFNVELLKDNNLKISFYLIKLDEFLHNQTKNTNYFEYDCSQLILDDQ